MINITQTHLDIARERFLEIMAENPNNDARDTAIAAIEQADEFVSAYSALRYNQFEQPQVEKKTVGCRICHGSGGKRINPCKACSGTGRVSA